jgi:nicotinate-nucleotide adenylyltransferase
LIAQGAPAPRRIGVFGGGFDPPHRAHVALARAALDQLGLDTLRILPTGQAWHKSRPLSPTEHRVAMARLAFEDLPGVVIDDRELLRAGPSYTVDTLASLAAEFPGAEFFLLMGGDQWAAFGTWRRWQDIAARARLCVLGRPGAAQTAQPGLPAPIVLQAPLQEISATAVREGLASGRLHGADLAALLPEAVARYISAHGLYSPPQPGPPALHA